MEQFVERGSTYNDCLQKVRAKWGERARVVDYRTIRIGGLLGTDLFSREGIEVTGYVVSELPQVLGAFGGSRPGGSLRPSPVGPSVQAAPAAPPLDFETERQKILALAPAAVQARPPDPAVQNLVNKVEALTEKLNAALVPAKGSSEDHPTLVQLEELFAQNDFSPAYARAMLERVRKEFSLGDLEDFDAVQERVVEWIGETVRIYQEGQDAALAAPRRLPRILVLVGPTGVGKTTTIAKLAAAYGVRGWGKEPLRVVMITIDGYRIAAREQLEKYGDIMKIPVAFVSDEAELRKTIAFYQDDADLILVDTIGKSPRDAAELGRMKQFLDACGSSAEAHLAITAGSKCSDIRDILRQFAPFNYQAVAITKLDETARVGNVISALFADGKPVSYVTDGQGVEKYIHRASVVRFLINLEGFVINREAIENRFSPGIQAPQKAGEQ
ncbi:MAG: flagellar biosynthesis protein FlhF [Treponema sp.]|nr:flagellar biosynthesis protein FlhF [Treponema sp.]